MTLQDIINKYNIDLNRPLTREIISLLQSGLKEADLPLWRVEICLRKK